MVGKKLFYIEDTITRDVYGTLAVDVLSASEMYRQESNTASIMTASSLGGQDSFLWLSPSTPCEDCILNGSISVGDMEVRPFQKVWVPFDAIDGKSVDLSSLYCKIGDAHFPFQQEDLGCFILVSDEHLSLTLELRSWLSKKILAGYVRIHVLPSIPSPQDASLTWKSATRDSLSSSSIQVLSPVIKKTSSPVESVLAPPPFKLLRADPFILEGDGNETIILSHTRWLSGFSKATTCSFVSSLGTSVVDVAAVLLSEKETMCYVPLLSNASEEWTVCVLDSCLPILVRSGVTSAEVKTLSLFDLDEQQSSTSETNVTFNVVEAGMKSAEKDGDLLKIFMQVKGGPFVADASWCLKQKDGKSGLFLDLDQLLLPSTSLYMLSFRLIMEGEMMYFPSPLEFALTSSSCGDAQIHPSSFITFKVQNEIKKLVGIREQQVHEHYGDVDTQVASDLSIYPIANEYGTLLSVKPASIILEREQREMEDSVVLRGRHFAPQLLSGKTCSFTCSKPLKGVYRGRIDMPVEFLSTSELRCGLPSPLTSFCVEGSLQLAVPFLAEEFIDLPIYQAMERVYSMNSSSILIQRKMKVTFHGTFNEEAASFLLSVDDHQPSPICSKVDRSLVLCSLDPSILPLSGGLSNVWLWTQRRSNVSPSLLHREPYVLRSILVPYIQDIELDSSTVSIRLLDSISFRYLLDPLYCILQVPSVQINGQDKLFFSMASYNYQASLLTCPLPKSFLEYQQTQEEEANFLSLGGIIPKLHLSFDDASSVENADMVSLFPISEHYEESLGQVWSSSSVRSVEKRFKVHP
jgi:hypothetical protein